VKRLKRSITAQFVLTVSVMSAVVIAALVLMTVAVRNVQTTDAQRTKSFDVLTTANELEQTVLELETGVRGYLLAGEKSQFLAPYTTAVANYPAIAGRLDQLTVGDRYVYQVAGSIQSTIGTYLSNWTAPLIQLAKHSMPAARVAEARGGGDAIIQAIRSQFQALLTKEGSIHAAQVRDANGFASFAVVVGVGSIAIFVLMVAFIAYKTENALVRPLRRLWDGGAKIIQGDLSSRIEPGGVAELGELVHGFNRMAGSLERQRGELAANAAEAIARKAAFEIQNAELEAHNAELEIALAAIDERKSAGAAPAGAERRGGWLHHRTSRW
jgi:methyl-accepting chemotaxis protein